jgi:putative spermidine/putrescine transport system permease protein
MVTSTAPGIVGNDSVVGSPALKKRLQRVGRRRRLRALLLVLPLFLFLVISFVVPIGNLLFKAVYDPELGSLLPKTAVAIREWDGQDLPPEDVFAAFAEDIKAAHKSKNTGLIGKRLNYEIGAIRSVVVKTGRELSKTEAGPWKDVLLDINKAWGKRELWATIKRGTEPLTPFYLLSAVDLRLNAENDVVAAPPDQSIFRRIFLRTLWISSLVTGLTLLLGYPIAYLLARLPTRISNLLLILVLLPFWTSLLVRTTAWIVLLQTHGVINDLALWLGLLDERVQLIFNRLGTVLAMTHIQLPFTILPIYSVMKTIPPTHVRAARSLGAGPFYVFWRVYFPQTVPGIAAGCLLTFILALGYYITPALVGGPNDQMVSYFVALYTNRELNWGMASALGAVLLAITLVLFFVYNRLIGIDRMKLG